MKISIITVCYNSVATIEKTILSVVGQSYKNVEYIIVDGNSNDGTVDIIKNNQDKITQWVSEPDNGLYDAMNKGIALATGDLIGILNSDDTFYSDNVLSAIADFHSKNTIDASVGNIMQNKYNGKMVRIYSSKNWSPGKLKIGFMPPHPSIFLKRELFNKFGNYSLVFKVAADYELVIRLFLKNDITWKYSNITSTCMLIGGVSSSGASSYRTITNEICGALNVNNINFNRFRIKIRFLWKITEFINKL